MSSGNSTAASSTPLDSSVLSSLLSSISESIASSTPPPEPTSTPPSETPSSSTPPPSSSTPPPTSLFTSVFTTSPNGQSNTPITQIITITSIPQQSSTPATSTPSQTASQAASSSETPLQAGGGGSSSGLSPAGKTAVAVVVPVVVVALLVVGGIFLWRRRKQRKDEEETRRKEVEDYGYNPNNDPTLPPIGGIAGSEMAEDSSGYRGWGNTTNPSTGRKTSTTVSGGMNAGYSDNGSNQGGYISPGSPTQGAALSESGNSVDPLVGGRRRTLDSDGIGALGAGPAAGTNPTNIRRGPSNASSSYSVGNRSESSDGQAPVGSPYDYSQMENAYYQPGMYGEQTYNGGQQPIIRDVSARRNTRIENPSFNPSQGNSGIAQNF